MQYVDIETMQQKMGEMHVYVDIKNKIMQAIEGKFALWKQELYKDFDARVEECMCSLIEKDNVVAQCKSQVWQLLGTRGSPAFKMKIMYACQL